MSRLRVISRIYGCLRGKWDAGFSREKISGSLEGGGKRYFENGHAVKTPVYVHLDGSNRKPSLLPPRDFQFLLKHPRPRLLVMENAPPNVFIILNV